MGNLFAKPKAPLAKEGTPVNNTAKQEDLTVPHDSQPASFMTGSNPVVAVAEAEVNLPMTHEQQQPSFVVYDHVKSPAVAPIVEAELSKESIVDEPEPAMKVETVTTTTTHHLERSVETDGQTVTVVEQCITEAVQKSDEKDETTAENVEITTVTTTTAMDEMSTPEQDMHEQSLTQVVDALISDLAEAEVAELAKVIDTVVDTAMEQQQAEYRENEDDKEEGELDTTTSSSDTSASLNDESPADELETSPQEEKEDEEVQTREQPKIVEKMNHLQIE